MKHFQSFGPNMLSAQAIQQYQELEPNSVPDMYYIWLNESYPDGVRRAALRDLLRQSHYGDDRQTYKLTQTSSSFWNIVSLAGDITVEKLEHELKNRPKLLSELIGELTFNLENDLMTKGEDLDRIIECILQIIPLDEAQVLFRYHSCKNHDRIRATCRALINNRRFPREISDALIQYLIDEMPENAYFLLHNDNCAAILQMLLHLSRAKGSDFHFTEHVIAQLDAAQLPADTMSSLLGDLHVVYDIAPRLADTELAYRTSVHFLRNNRYISRDEGTIFLFWFEGLAHHLGKLDEETEKLIAAARAKLL